MKALTHRTLKLSLPTYFSISPRLFFHSSSHPPYSSHSHEDSRNVKVSVWWDIENCPVPVGVNVFRVSHRIVSALRANGIKGPVSITAIGDVYQISRSSQEALTWTGISLTHIPRGNESADRSLLVDLAYWVSQNPPPAHLFLISGDRDFAKILHRLRMNNYNILLANTTGCASGALCSVITIMWHWTDLVTGDNITGKHFNDPPDGPYDSWYGHYKGPLHDPFLDMKQPVCSQPDDSFDPSMNPKPRPIPKVLVNWIRQILYSYPEGVSLPELRAELMKSYVLDKDYFGYKSFSRLLSSMPNVLKLLRHPSGDQLLAYGIHPKATKQSESSSKSSAEIENINGGKDRKVAAEKDEKSMASTPLPKVEEPSIVCTEINADSTVASSTSMEERNSKNEEGFFQYIWGTWFSHTGDASIEKNDKFSTSTDGPGTDGAANARSCNGTEKAEANKKAVQSDLLRSNSSSSNVSESVLEDKIAWHSEKNDVKSSSNSGFFNQIVKKCKFWKNSKESPDSSSLFVDQTLTGQSADTSGGCSSEDANQINCYPEDHAFFSRVYFWHLTKSFLGSPKGSALISQSRTRENMVSELKKQGPRVLKSFTAGQLLRLVELLISEKKWVKECASQTFPFKLTLPDKQKCSSSQTCGSNALRSIFLGRIEKQDHNIMQDGNSASGNVDFKQPHNIAELKVWLKKLYNGTGDIDVEDLKRHYEREFNIKLDCNFYGCSTLESLLAACSISKKKPPKVSQRKMVADCQKLLTEVLEEHPEGFNMGGLKLLFLERYGYALDHQMLGYPKLASLLQIIPGLKIESTFILPAKKPCRYSSQEKLEREEILSSNIENNVNNLNKSGNCVWDELGPISEVGLNENGSIDQEMPDRVGSDKESASNEDFSESDVEIPTLDKSKLQGNYISSKGSSLLQVLDSWYSSNDRDKNDQKENNKSIDGFVDCSTSGSTPLETINVGVEESIDRKMKTRQSYKFVSDSVDDDEEEKLINSILDSLKKSSNSRLQS